MWAKRAKWGVGKKRLGVTALEDIHELYDKIKNDFGINYQEIKAKIYNDDNYEGALPEKAKEEFKKFFKKCFSMYKEKEYLSPNVKEVTLPSWFSEIDNNSIYLQMLERIHHLWGEKLIKQVNGNYEENRTTLIKLENSIIVPGGRFREFYYWDSYWILEGLIAGELFDDAFILIKNFCELIKKFGFIPNGTRHYYLNRTQPPFFTRMLYKLYVSTQLENIKNFILTEGIECALKEYDFFMEKKAVGKINDKDVVLNRYFVDSNIPRLESLREDVDTYRRAENKKEIFSNLTTVAESGWDFSTRWQKKDGGRETIDIINIIPVDLNAYMFTNEKFLIELIQFYLKSSDKIDSQAEKYYKLAQKLSSNNEKRGRDMNEYLWNNDANIWNDFNTKTGLHTTHAFYFSNLTPIFAGLTPPKGNVYDILLKHKDYLFTVGKSVYTSGFIKSEEEYKEQWDYPNTWAPFVHLLVDFLVDEGLYNLGLLVATNFSNLAKSVYEKTGLLLEKYSLLASCSKSDQHEYASSSQKKEEERGKEGEYPVQEGFGWTNGVLTVFFKHFKNDIVEKITEETASLAYKELISRKSKVVFNNATEEQDLITKGKGHSIKVKA